MRTMTDTVGADRADLTASRLPTPATPMSTATLSDTDTRRERIAQLQQRRAATSGTATSSAAASADPASSASAVTQPSRPASAAARAPRAGTATGSKVAAAGIGFAAMLGLVAVMGFAGRSSATKPQLAGQLAAPPAQIVVVVHPADGAATQATASATAGPIVAASSQPIVLSAQPTVRQAPPSPAPAGQTNGSR